MIESEVAELLRQLLEEQRTTNLLLAALVESMADAMDEERSGYLDGSGDEA